MPEAHIGNLPRVLMQVLLERPQPAHVGRRQRRILIPGRLQRENLGLHPGGAQPCNGGVCKRHAAAQPLQAAPRPDGFICPVKGRTALL